MLTKVVGGMIGKGIGALVGSGAGIAGGSGAGLMGMLGAAGPIALGIGAVAGGIAIGNALAKKAQQESKENHEGSASGRTTEAKHSGRAKTDESAAAIGSIDSYGDTAKGGVASTKIFGVDFGGRSYSNDDAAEYWVQDKP